MGDIFDDVEKLLAEEDNAESAMEASAETNPVEDDAQIFNDNELEDIMAEIESLEKDFEVTGSEKAVDQEELKMDSSKIEKTDLQKVIDNELESIEIANELESLENEIANENEIEASTKTDEIPDELSEALAQEKVIATVKEEVNNVVPIDLKAAKKNSQFICYEDLLNYSYTPTTEETFQNNPTAAPAMSNHSKSEMSFSASGMMNVNLVFKVGAEEAKLFIDEEKGLVVSMSGVEVCLNELNGCTVTMENGANFTIPLTQKNSSTTKKVA